MEYQESNMKAKLAALINAQSLLDISGFADFDYQVKEQFIPLTQGLYHQTLLVEDLPQHYLQLNYDIKQKEINQYQLGYCNRQLGKYLPHFRSSEGVKLRSALHHLKVLHPSGHEAFRGCLVVPVFYQDEIVAFYGERIGRTCRGVSASYWHPIDKPAIFNIDNIHDSSCVFICQSPLIAIQMMKAFKGNVIATDPSFSFCDEDLQCLVDKGVKTIIAVKHTDVSRTILMNFAKHLAKFGISYESLDCTQGGKYGTA